MGFGLGTSWIEREIQKAILKVRIKGLGKQHGPQFSQSCLFN
ncbi:hypothetical protein [Pediococcus acidilactici]